MNTLVKISQQTIWQLIGKVVTSLSTLLILSLVSRHYGTSGTGVFTLALTYLSLFYLLTDFGINGYLLPALKEKPVGVMRRLIGLRSLLSVGFIVIALALTLFLPFANAEFRQAVIYGSLSIVFASFYISVNAIFQSKLRYDLSIIASSLGTIVATGLIVIFIHYDLAVPYLLLPHLAGWIIDAAVAAYFARGFISPIRPVFEKSFILATLKGVWPISVTLVFNLIYFRLDTFILSSFKGFAEVGIYNLAYQIFQSALVVPTFIMNSYYPMMIDQLSTSSQLFYKRFKKAAMVMLALGALGTIATWVLASELINLISGSGFSSSAHALQILALGFPAFFLSSLLMWALVTLKRYRSLVIIYFVGLSVNAGLNLIFIPQFSFIASSYITGFCEYLIAFLLLLILFRHKR